MNPVSKFSFNVNRILDRMYIYLGARGLMPFDTDRKFLYHKYRLLMGFAPNLDTPKTFSEKQQWLKLYDRNPIYTKMVDKVTAKDYVAAKIGSSYVIKTYGVWDRYEDIDINNLPEKFVLKCTHDSGGLAIVRNKKNFDYVKTGKLLNIALKRNYYMFNREWPYKNVKPRILAEEYLEDEDVHDKDLTDYKFFCFNGNPKFLYISTGLENHSTARMNFVTLEWKKTSFQRLDFKEYDVLPPKPKTLSQMIEIAQKLSENIPFIRVDLYSIGHKVLFSELTFFPKSGFIVFNDDKYDREIGEILNLPVF